MNPVKLTEEHVKKLLYGLKSLDVAQRALVKETLVALGREHGEIWPADLHRALQHLRAEFKISEIDARAVEAAVFGV